MTESGYIFIVPNRPVQTGIPRSFSGDCPRDAPQTRCNIWNRRIGQQGFSCGALDKAKDLILIPEAHLGFRRMDIDVHLVRRDFQEESSERISSYHQ